MQDYVTPTGLAMLGSVAAAIIVSFASIFIVPKSDTKNWLLVSPGGGHWFGMFGSIAFFALTGWVWIFVGSGRSDAAFQMNVAFWLSFTFGLCAIYMALVIRAMNKKALRLRGQQIAYRDGNGNEGKQKIADFTAFRRRWRGDYQLLFNDGTVLSLDPFAKNSDEFMGRLFDDPPRGTT